MSRRSTAAVHTAARVLAAALALSGCDELGLQDGTTPVLPPKLAFADTHYDFGSVAQGVPVEHRFTFSNEGGTALTIINVHAACDCTATVEGGSEIPAHGTGVVQARLATDAVYGALRRTITVSSTDPAQHPVVLTLTGNVVLDVAADPPAIYLGVIPPGAPAQRAALLRTGSEATHLGAPESDAPQLAIQLDAAADPGAAAGLTIGIAPDAPLGPFSAVIRVPTTSARHPVLRIPVAGIIAADAPTPRAPAPPNAVNTPAAAAYPAGP